MAKPKVRIIPLGGLGEIGKNMTAFEMGNDAIIIDTGIMFPANDMHGVDYIIPDFRYLTERPNLKIHGILFTHGHEDHTGAVAHVVDAFPGVPIWATPLTAALLEVKLRDGRVSDRTKVNRFEAGDIITVGPFTVESFHMCHSIPDCVGFAINTPYGLIVHSGDYKFDNTPVDGKQPDYARLADYSKRGTVLLLADSTNADQPGWTPSESVVTGAFENIFRNARGRIMVATFASHISRIQQVASLAELYGRKLVIAGHTMTENVKMTRKMGLLNIKDETLVDLSRIDDFPTHKIAIMLTGSQGEPSAVLTRIATGQHRQLEVMEGDTIIVSAHAIPGNEEMVYRTINRLFQKGADVVYDPIAPVHVSGHARQEEMRLLLHLVRPKYFVPVHGELRHLKEHAKLAAQAGVSPENIFVVENGVVIEVDRYGVHTGERVPGGYVFVDGSGVGDIGKSVIRDRETLARDGFIMVVVNVDSREGQVIGEPEIISRGFVYLREADELMKQVRNTVFSVVERNPNGRLREQLQESISKVLYNETKRRP
ncbi:MAG: ribonuclease J, partial [Anaerolineae bacterium]|nr:ribonuclease J [Anaerolineae bacterium]